MYFNSLSIQPLCDVTVNDVSYSYFIQGTGPVLFFLHGFPDSAYTWDTIIDELSKSYTCIAPFLRGYYPSGIPKNGDYSMKTVAQDIDEIAKSLDIETYSVIGHDCGATVAYTMANLFPNRVNKICTIGMPHPKFLKPTIPLMYKARHISYLMNEKKSPKRIKNDNYSYLTVLYNRWSPNWRDFHGTLDQMVTDFNREGRIEAALAYYWQLKNKPGNSANHNLYNALPKVPVLSFVGSKDGTVIMKQFRQMKAELNGNFKLINHPTAGHFLHLEESAFFIEEFNKFSKQS